MDLHGEYGIKIYDRCKYAINFVEMLTFLPSMLRISVFDY